MDRAEGVAGDCMTKQNQYQYKRFKRAGELMNFNFCFRVLTAIYISPHSILLWYYYYYYYCDILSLRIRLTRTVVNLLLVVAQSQQREFIYNNNNMLRQNIHHKTHRVIHLILSFNYAFIQIIIIFGILISIPSYFQILNIFT